MNSKKCLQIFNFIWNIWKSCRSQSASLVSGRATQQEAARTIERRQIKIQFIWFKLIAQLNTLSNLERQKSTQEIFKFCSIFNYASEKILKIRKSCNSCNRWIWKSSVRFGVISPRLYTCPRDLAARKIRFQSFNILSRKNWQIFFRFQLFKFSNVSIKYISFENSSINQRQNPTKPVEWKCLEESTENRGYYDGAAVQSYMHMIWKL